MKSSLLWYLIPLLVYAWKWWREEEKKAASRPIKAPPPAPPPVIKAAALQTKAPEPQLEILPASPSAPKKQRNYLNRKSFKQAIIMKEILEKRF